MLSPTTASPASASTLPRTSPVRAVVESFRKRQPTVDAVVTDEGELAFTAEAPLLYASFAYFMGALVDSAGRRLRCDPHHEEWAELMQREPLLCLLAPRDHGKSWTDIAYILWRVWRHNRNPFTGELYETNPDGTFQAVLFSDTLPQAEQFFEHFQAILLANPQLFADIQPSRIGGRRDIWSKRRVKLRNGADVLIRGYRTSTRGLHPDLIILDDVLNDTNTLTQYQRDKVWRYFAGTLLPMGAKQYIVIGTAFHFDDLLHRLRPRRKDATPLVIGGARVSFRWMKYRAVDFETGDVLWPWRHSLANLEGLKGLLGPLLFAREFQNDPIDDSSSIFPYTLTAKALNSNYGFVTSYHKAAGEYVVLGMDLAVSAEASADYTVIKVWAWDRPTGKRRLLHVWRQQGMGLTEQITMLRTICVAYGVDVGVIENNGFQTWLHHETTKYPETANRLVGHRTGQEKQDLQSGVPSIRIGLENGVYTIPTGDEESATYAAVWQSEMAAYGPKDGKFQGVGEHDDTVMATWFSDVGVRLLEEWLAKADENQIVTIEDMGMERVTIGPPY